MQESKHSEPEHPDMYEYSHHFLLSFSLDMINMIIIDISPTGWSHFFHAHALHIKYDVLQVNVVVTSPDLGKARSPSGFDGCMLRADLCVP